MGLATKGISPEQTFNFAQVATEVTHTVGTAATINFGSTRVSYDTSAGGATNTFNWASNSFTAINGVFAVDITVELFEGTGGVTAVELVGNIAATNTTYRDYVKIDDGGNIEGAVLKLNLLLAGNFDGTSGTLETMQVDVNVTGDAGASIKIMPASSIFNVCRIGGAPSSITSPIDNSTEVAASPVT